MLFLIDYENVGGAGMKGCDCLDEQDYMIVFYSEAKQHMEKRNLDNITSSGCIFEVCKLCKTGKNALDFYIASRLGELFGEGYNGVAVIVSNDSGFQAVCDYWEKRATPKRRIILSNCIEDGIVSGNENNERTRELRRQREKLAIGGYYSAYTERIRIKAVLRKIFDGTQYESKIDEIQNMIAGKEKTSKIIYLDSLHLFGRKEADKDTNFVDDFASAYYLRLSVADESGVLAKIASVLSKYHVSIVEMIQREKEGGKASIVLVTHETHELAIKNAVEKINSTEIAKVESVLRVVS